MKTRHGHHLQVVVFRVVSRFFWSGRPDLNRVHHSSILLISEHLVNGEMVNEIVVDFCTREDAKIALDQVLAVP